MLITMSDKEIQRLAVLQDVRDQRITQVRAAEILNLSTRQITRLLHKLNQDGVSGLAHASRGQPGHHPAPKRFYRDIQVKYAAELLMGQGRSKSQQMFGNNGKTF